MEEKPLLSIIIPIYNGRKNIDRLLDSIIISTNCRYNTKYDGIGLENIEIIISDDYSTDKTVNHIKRSKYSKKLNIKYTKPDKKLKRCPGNNRQAGLSIASGEWVTFIDQDDIFVEGGLFDIFVLIQQKEIKYYLCGSFARENLSGYLSLIEGITADTWLHGKFYNMDNFIKPFKIEFKKDLISHEDLYFNSCCAVATRHIINYEQKRYDNPIYIWKQNEESFSNSKFKNGYYIDEFMEEYIKAGTEPYLEDLLTFPYYKEDYFAHCCSILLHAYFYYQSNRTKYGDQCRYENLQYIHGLKKKITETFGYNSIDIINFVYGDPIGYNEVKKECCIGTDPFVELVSFRDFILNN